VKLFTIGYEHSGQRVFVHTLRDAGVATVIDVRELPLSRRAGFSKGALAAALAAEGLGYAHLKALGTPKEGRIANKRHDWPRFWSIVDAQLATPEADAAFEHAARLARAAPSCLLCLEADSAVCHRSRVAAEMARRYGFDVHNLTVERSLA
jgi:uncharacterized protein (DUF488 family)